MSCGPSNAQQGGNQNVAYKLAAACIALCAIATARLLAADESIKKPMQASTSERVTFASGGTIRFDKSFGDLYVEGWDQPQVEMTLIKLFENYERPKNAAARLERVRVTTQHPSANELAIETTIPSRSFFRHPFGGKGDVNVRYEFHVPRDSNLIIDHGGGNILIDNVTGGIEARNRDGDIVLMLPDTGPYSIDAKSKMGTVISDFAGKAQVRYFVGERFTGGDGNAPHKILLRVGFGGITIKAVPPEAVPRAIAAK
jgi:hypothetical protein